MKRWLFVLLALVMLVSVSGQAEEALFDMDCPEGWTYDDESYKAENTPDTVWMCEYRHGDELSVNVSREYLQDWKGVTLTASEPELLAAYKAELDSLYTVMAMSMQCIWTPDGNVFFPYAVADEYGLYVVALTLINGWEVAVTLEAQQVIQPEDLATLTDMLSTFALRGEPEEWTVPEIVPNGSYSL